MLVLDPRGRVGHSMVKGISNEVYVFGGRTKYEMSGIELIYNDLWTVRYLHLQIVADTCTDK